MGRALEVSQKRYLLWNLQNSRKISEMEVKGEKQTEVRKRYIVITWIRGFGLAMNFG